MIDVSSTDEEKESEEKDQQASPNANENPAKTDGSTPVNDGDPFHGVYTQKDP